MSDKEATSSPDTGDSIAADLHAAFDAAEAASTPSATNAPAPATNKPADAKPTPQVTTERGAAATTATGNNAPASSAAPVDAPTAPTHWPKEDQDKFNELAASNPDRAAWLLARHKAMEGDHTRKTQELKPFRDLREKIDPLLAPSRQQRLMRGVSDEAYLQSIVAAADFLEKNPVEGLKQLASQYGVDFAAMAQQAQQQQEQIPPYVRELHQQIEHLKQGYNGIQTQSQEQQLATAQAQLEAFAGEKDANGQPLRPYFADVMQEIGMNIQFQRQMNPGAQVDLQAAYDKAIRMNDQVWSRHQLAQSEAQRKAAEEQRAKEVAEAKRGGFSVTGSGAAATTAPADSLYDELSRAYDRATA